MVARAGKGGNKELLGNEYRVSVLQYEKSYGADDCDGCTL